MEILNPANSNKDSAEVSCMDFLCVLHGCEHVGVSMRACRHKYVENCWHCSSALFTEAGAQSNPEPEEVT